MSPVIRTQVLTEGVPLSALAPEGALTAGESRWAYQTERDAQAFERAWFADFRARWQRDLASHRQAFRLRMEAV